MGNLVVGVIFRTFAQSEERFRANAANLVDGVWRLLAPHASVSNICIAVWNDRRYRGADGHPVADQVDSAGRLGRIFAQEPRVYIHNCTDGDRYVDILNQAFELQYHTGITHSIVLSPEAVRYINLPTLDAMRKAVDDGALIVPVAITEDAEIMRDGHPNNVFCMYDVKELLAVGGFDIRDRLPLYPGDQSSGTIYVEFEDQMIPTSGMDGLMAGIALWRKHRRPIIAPVEPAGVEGASYLVLPDSRGEDWGQYRKRASKRARASKVLEILGSSWDELRCAILPRYRK